ncbi:hypothetical protein [Corynebacterium ulceribovis]|uniref:hypothetical protein n=1 Tax=Corynebacterium ulceribovis TaxID=487732 RepID=UPI00036789AD|nr:hypothetical protein [Corynebacterium ulceribovis]
MDAKLLIVPGAPLLVRDLAGDDPAAASLHADVVAAVREFAAGEPVDVVIADDERWHTEHEGSFKAWGADLTVGYGKTLPELVARYLAREAGTTVGLVLTGLPDMAEYPNKVLVVAEGTAALTERAPMAFQQRAVDIESYLEAIAGGDVSTSHRGAADLASVGQDNWEPVGLFTGPLWMDLAAQRPADKQLLVHNTEFGVGYFVARWSW